MNVAYTDGTIKEVLVSTDENDNTATNGISIDEYNRISYEVDQGTHALSSFSLEHEGTTYTIDASTVVADINTVDSVSLAISGRVTEDDNTSGDFLFVFNTEDDATQALISQGANYFDLVMDDATYGVTYLAAFTRAGMSLI